MGGGERPVLFLEMLDTKFYVRKTDKSYQLSPFANACKRVGQVCDRLELLVRSL